MTHLVSERQSGPVQFPNLEASNSGALATAPGITPGANSAAVSTISPHQDSPSNQNQNTSSGSSERCCLTNFICSMARWIVLIATFGLCNLFPKTASTDSPQQEETSNAETPPAQGSSDTSNPAVGSVVEQPVVPQGSSTVGAEPSVQQQETQPVEMSLPAAEPSATAELSKSTDPVSQQPNVQQADSKDPVTVDATIEESTDGKETQASQDTSGDQAGATSTTPNPKPTSSYTADTVLQQQPDDAAEGSSTSEDPSKPIDANAGGSQAQPEASGWFSGLKSGWNAVVSFVSPARKGPTAESGTQVQTEQPTADGDTDPAALPPQLEQEGASAASSTPEHRLDEADTAADGDIPVMTSTAVPCPPQGEVCPPHQELAGPSVIETAARLKVIEALSRLHELKNSYPKNAIAFGLLGALRDEEIEDVRAGLAELAASRDKDREFAEMKRVYDAWKAGNESSLDDVSYKATWQALMFFMFKKNPKIFSEHSLRGLIAASEREQQRSQKILDLVPVRQNLPPQEQALLKEVLSFIGDLTATENDEASNPLSLNNVLKSSLPAFIGNHEIAPRFREGRIVGTDEIAEAAETTRVEKTRALESLKFMVENRDEIFA